MSEIRRIILNFYHKVHKGFTQSSQSTIYNFFYFIIQKNNLKLCVLCVLFFVYFVVIFLPGCHFKKAPPDEMVLVPKGEFIMGTDETDKEGKADSYGLPMTFYDDERPLRKVFLESYYIDIYEVTMEKYKKFVDETGYEPPPTWIGKSYPAGLDKFPVVYVDLADSDAYAKWAGKRIPREEEWEKAARGTEGRLYPWGNDFNPEKANLSVTMSSKGEAKMTGSFKEGISPYGVHDMIGNVWEWTINDYAPYEGNTNKKISWGKGLKVLRGGSWFSIGHFPDDIYRDILSHISRGSYREESSPYIKSVDVGFRCVKDVK